MDTQLIRQATANVATDLVGGAGTPRPPRWARRSKNPRIREAAEDMVFAFALGGIGKVLTVEAVRQTNLLTTQVGVGEGMLMADHFATGFDALLHTICQQRMIRAFL